MTSSWRVCSCGHPVADHDREGCLYCPPASCQGAETSGRVLSAAVGPRTDRRRRRWCYECGNWTLTHAYPTDLLEAEIDLCDQCAMAINEGTHLGLTAPASTPSGPTP